ncbi:MAG: ABC transporter permease [Vicinamibacterales bacterium]
MRRVLIVAQNEVLGLVRSKFFIIGILVMPVCVGVLMTFLGYASSRVDHADRRFAVLDRTGVLYPAVQEAAAQYNREKGEGAERSGPHFLPEPVADTAGQDDAALLAGLSDRVRRGDLFAFVEIPAGALDPGSTAAVKYYTQNTSYVRLSTWLASTLDGQVQQERLKRAGMDPRLVRQLTRRTELASFGLTERRADGSTTEARRVDELQRFGIPIFFLVLMFMSVMSNAQHLINTIIEEKMSKISEVLLGSISSFQLLAGKLVGVVVVSLLLAAVYLIGGAYTLFALGRPDLIDPVLLGWFVVFLLCAALLYGSLFQALSSACSDLKDAQSLLQPAMMMLIMAYLSSMLVLRAPDSALAVGLSFVPVLTPFAMLLRLSMPPGPPLWQALLSVAILMTTTVAVVWAAARIFRVGLLMQGKAPNLPELLRWIRK